MRKRVPNSVKAISLLAAVVLILLAIYVVLGSSPLNAVMAFRRAERGNMIGPSRIIATLGAKHQLDYPVIVAQTDKSYVLYCASSDLRENGVAYRRFYTYTKGDEQYYANFNAYEKTDSMSLYGLPGYNYDPQYLILFDQEPRAVRAEIHFQLDYIFHDRSYTMTISRRSSRQYSGFFLFQFNKPSQSSDNWYSAMSSLNAIARYYTDDKPDVTVRLYDLFGNLICEDVIQPGPGHNQS